MTPKKQRLHCTNCGAKLKIDNTGDLCWKCKLLEHRRLVCPACGKRMSNTKKLCHLCERKAKKKFTFKICKKCGGKMRTTTPGGICVKCSYIRRMTVCPRCGRPMRKGNEMCYRCYLDSKYKSFREEADEKIRKEGFKPLSEKYCQRCGKLVLDQQLLPRTLNVNGELTELLICPRCVKDLAPHPIMATRIIKTRVIIKKL